MPDRFKSPVTIPSHELEAAFTASSQRVTMAFLRAQIHEAAAHGADGTVWVNQLRVAVERIELALAENGLAGPMDLPLAELGYDDGHLT